MKKDACMQYIFYVWYIQLCHMPGRNKTCFPSCWWSIVVHRKVTYLDLFSNQNKCQWNQGKNYCSGYIYSLQSWKLWGQRLCWTLLCSLHQNTSAVTTDEAQAASLEPMPLRRSDGLAEVNRSPSKINMHETNIVSVEETRQGNLVAV